MLQVFLFAHKSHYFSFRLQNKTSGSLKAQNILFRLPEMVFYLAAETAGADADVTGAPNHCTWILS